MRGGCRGGGRTPIGGAGSGIPRYRALRVAAKYRRGLLRGGDGRSKHVRDLRARYQQLVTDLGGEAELSSIEIARAERLAHVEHWLSRIETLSRGKDVGLPPLDKYLPLVYLSLRLGDSLGVKRRARKVATLAEYIEAASKEPPP